eukprot:TRINITY_DN3190_c0_g2_i5.p1 TRINITY_DN3190_c0_g2~~TRINITY_DN3190_c0_g2_i5.p1  ORF type:complete len:832 (-),score=199.87 TRINITY_DN3190_c0_g2_i5:77-2548(-)
MQVQAQVQAHAQVRPKHQPPSAPPPPPPSRAHGRTMAPQVATAITGQLLQARHKALSRASENRPQAQTHVAAVLPAKMSELGRAVSLCTPQENACEALGKVVVEKGKPPMPPPRKLEQIPITHSQVILCQHVIRSFVKRRTEEKRSVQRSRVVTEILTTERTYLALLTTLVRYYFFPLQRAAESATPVVSMKSIGDIFSNVCEVIHVNQELLKKLEDRIPNWGPTSMIGDVFLALIPYLKLYTIYCANHYTATEKVAQESSKASFGAFLKSAGTESGHPEKSLDSYLILPVQRIPRYQLLLKEVVKLTPAGHPDLKNLEEALANITKVATHINTTIKERQMLEQIVALQKQFTGYCPPLVAPRRSLIREGELTKICRKAPKPRHFFLFTDCLLYAVRLEPAMLYKYHLMVGLEGASVKTVDYSIKTQFAFQLLTKEKSFTICAKDEEEKAQWVDALKTAIENTEKGRRPTSIICCEEKAEVAPAPVWLPDAERENCTICQSRFTMTHRRHHCRKCGTLVCNECSSDRFFLENVNDYVRVCTNCFEELCRQFGAEYGRRAERSSKQKAFDTTNPAGWSSKELQVWICSLESGRFSDYAVKMKKMTGVELVRFNFELLKLVVDKEDDATALFAHIQKLKQAAVPSAVQQQPQEDEDDDEDSSSSDSDTDVPPATGWCVVKSARPTSLVKSTTSRFGSRALGADIAPPLEPPPTMRTSIPPPPLPLLDNHQEQAAHTPSLPAPLLLSDQQRTPRHLPTPPGTVRAPSIPPPPIAEGNRPPTSSIPPPALPPAGYTAAAPAGYTEVAPAPWSPPSPRPLPPPVVKHS